MLIFWTVQDTKSDRVKQLLKETEKYLQKLSSKLKEAKDTARSFEMEMDDGRGINVEKNEISVGTEDESDQAQASIAFVKFLVFIFFGLL